MCVLRILFELFRSLIYHHRCAEVIHMISRTQDDIGHGKDDYYHVSDFFVP